MKVIVAPGPPALDDATARFVVVSNVLAGIQAFDRETLVGRDMHGKAARHVIASRGRVSALRTLKPDDKRRLRIAWQTELAARVSDQLDDDILRRVSAQTLPVQAYYAVFNAGRAATAVRGTICNTHSALHRDYSAQRARHGYRSWGVALVGDPDNVPSCVLTPAIGTPLGFNLMEQSHSPNDYVFAALRMTRGWKVETLRTEWLKSRKTKAGQPRKNLPAAERSALVSQLRPTTLLDYLYELRVRANYQGVEEYGSDADDTAVGKFHRGLLHLADMGLLHYEVDLAQTIGLAAFEAEVANWVSTTAKVGSWARKPVERRLGCIRDALVAP
jgi:hypothetical protein